MLNASITINELCTNVSVFSCLVFFSVHLKLNFIWQVNELLYFLVVFFREPFESNVQNVHIEDIRSSAEVLTRFPVPVKTNKNKLQEIFLHFHKYSKWKLFSFVQLKTQVFLWESLHFWYVFCSVLYTRFAYDMLFTNEYAWLYKQLIDIIIVYFV